MGPQDGRITDIFGPKFYVETDNPSDSDYGPEAFAIKGTNDDGCRFILAHHESNTTRIESEGDVIFNAGSKSSKFGTALNIISHGGDIQVNSTNNSIGIKASNELILEADKITLKANKIQIGDQFAHGTREITLNATRIEVDGQKGNLPFALGLGWGAAIAFGPGAFLGQAVAKKVFSR
tara:strand:- start:709 stop:1245 length:537 start_codon:yes stop_codon:yes gene_type:complete